MSTSVSLSNHSFSCASRASVTSTYLTVAFHPTHIDLEKMAREIRVLNLWEELK